MDIQSSNKCTITPSATCDTAIVLESFTRPCVNTNIGDTSVSGIIQYLPDVGYIAWVSGNGDSVALMYPYITDTSQLLGAQEWSSLNYYFILLSVFLSKQ